MPITFVAERVLPDAATQLAPGAVVVEGERITWVGPAAEAPPGGERVELDGAVLMPGLVNAHTHLDLTFLRGQVPYDGDFAAWLWSIVGKRRAAGIAEPAAGGIREAFARGTTTFGDIVAMQSFDEMLAAYAETGPRVRLFVEFVGFPPHVAGTVWERAWELAEMRALPPGVATGLGPHAPYSVSRALFAQAVAVADGHRRPVAVHVGESLEELAFLRHGIGPLREGLKRLGVDDPDYEPYGGLPEFLELLDLQRAPLLLVHCNYVRPRDIPARAFAVYCPTAHRFFGHPEHPVLELLEEGVRVVLGSDSAASGDTLDVLSETRFLARERPDLAPQAVFRMATEWGARALDLDAGRLEPGRLADLAAFTPAAGHEVLGREDARCVLAAVGGRIVHRDDAGGTAS